MNKKPKALVLLSGGLDSQLSMRVLRDAGCEVTALTFETPFFNAKKGRIAAEKLGVDIIVKNISELHFPIVLDPPHGRGKNMNPCIDCHGLMFRLAGEIAKEKGFQIIASGEVLGQRPFSQNKQALKVVEKIAGLENKLLRPLCAKNLPETEYEQSGLIDREKLLGFSGKNRKPQMALAKKMGLTDYPTPAGGCLLTDPGFSARFSVFLERDDTATPADAELIKVGRFLPIGKKSFAMIGRNQAENEKLQELGVNPRINSEVNLVRMQDFAGPTALLLIKKPDDFEKLLPEVVEKIRSYGRDSKKHEGEITFKIWGGIEKVVEI